MTGGGGGGGGAAGGVFETGGGVFPLTFPPPSPPLQPTNTLNTHRIKPRPGRMLLTLLLPREINAENASKPAQDFFAERRGLNFLQA
jgi:hypothetical protein